MSLPSLEDMAGDQPERARAAYLAAARFVAAYDDVHQAEGAVQGLEDLMAAKRTPLDRSAQLSVAQHRLDAARKRRSEAWQSLAAAMAPKR